MRATIQQVDEFSPRPQSSLPYVSNYPTNYIPSLPLVGLPYAIPRTSLTGNHPLSPRYSPEQAEMERKYSGTLGSTYDYRPPLIYPNSEPFRRDLDRKLTTIQHEELSEQPSRAVVRNSLFPNHHPRSQPTPEQPLCFNLCCVLIMLLGILSLSLCIYLFVMREGRTAWGGSKLSKEGHFLFLRKFNI